jgi:hypothetical protein
MTIAWLDDLKLNLSQWRQLNTLRDQEVKDKDCYAQSMVECIAYHLKLYDDITLYSRQISVAMESFLLAVLMQKFVYETRLSPDSTNEAKVSKY